MSCLSPQSFLLRLWREQTDDPLRATLISVTQPTEQRHFATLEALHSFLHTQLDAVQEPANGRDRADCTAPDGA